MLFSFERAFFIDRLQLLPLLSSQTRQLQLMLVLNISFWPHHALSEGLDHVYNGIDMAVERS